MEKVYLVNYTTSVYVKAESKDEAEEKTEELVFGETKSGINDDQFSVSVEEVGEKELKENEIEVNE